MWLANQVLYIRNSSADWPHNTTALRSTKLRRKGMPHFFQFSAKATGHETTWPYIYLRLSNWSIIRLQETFLICRSNWVRKCTRCIFSVYECAAKNNGWVRGKLRRKFSSICLTKCGRIKMADLQMEMYYPDSVWWVQIPPKWRGRNRIPFALTLTDIVMAELSAVWINQRSDYLQGILGRYNIRAWFHHTSMWYSKNQ